MSPDSRSESTLPGRMLRYARVGGAVAGQAAKLASARLTGSSVDRAEHASELRQALGGLKGPLMKVAQMMATIPDALPAEYASELAQLQSNAPPMGKPFVRRRMAAELGPDWQARFQDFPLDPEAAASLGQVHRAVLGDGRMVACKLQYPGIESAVEADLSQLKLILGLYRRWDRAIDTSQIQQEIAERLREELDYGREARHMALYRAILAGEPRVSVPGVYPEISTNRLLTMSWLEGKPFLSCKGLPQEARDELALAMFRAWYLPFYGYGVIHGDPHLGNYTIRADHGVNLLDFGCVRIFPPRFVKGVIDLYWALAKNDPDMAVAAYETWGFKDLSKAMIAILNEWAGFLYAPLLEDRPRRIQESNDAKAGRRVAERVHERLREAGGVQVPREFVFMDRAAIGLGSVFMHLDAMVNWHELFMGLIADFDVDVLAKRQADALDAAGLSPAPG